MQDLKTIGNFINQLKGLYSQLVQSVASSSVAASLNPDKREWFVIHMLLAVKKKNSTLAQAMGDQEILAQVLETTDSENIHTRVDEKLLEELATILTEPLIAHWREEFRDHQVGFKKAFNELYERLFRWLCMRDVPIAMLGEEPFVGSSIGEESGGHILRMVEPAYFISNRNERNEFFGKLMMKIINAYMNKTYYMKEDILHNFHNNLFSKIIFSYVDSFTEGEEKIVTPLNHLLSMIDWTNPELYGQMKEILKGIKGGNDMEYISAKLDEADKAIKQFIKTEELAGKTIQGMKKLQIGLVVNKHIQVVREAEASVDIQLIAKVFEVEQLIEQAPDPKVIERLPTYFDVDNESFPSIFDLIRNYGKEPSWQANEGFQKDKRLVLHLGALHKLKKVLDELDSKEKLYRYQFIDIKDNLDRAMAQLLEKLIKGKEYRDMLFIRVLQDEEREPALYVVNHGTEEDLDCRLEEFPSDRKKSRSIATKVVTSSMVDTRVEVMSGRN